MNDVLSKFLQLLLENGYKVWQTRESSCFAFFVKGNKIGYVQSECLGVTLSSVHKRCKKHRTGFRMTVRYIMNPGLEDAEQAIGNRPAWSDRHKVEKYESWEDRQSYPINTILEHAEVFAIDIN